MYICGWCSVAKSYPTLCRPGLQHTRLPLLSLSPRVCSNSCPLNQWFHPTISSSVTPFFSWPQSFPTSEPFPSHHELALCMGWPKSWSTLLSEKRSVWKGNILYESNYMRAWKSETIETINRWVIYKSCGRERWTGRARGILREWNYSVWSSNGGSMSLYICPNPQKVQHQEWTSM